MSLQVSNFTKVVSFDVFDTLITRRVATPLGIFHFMQSRLGSLGMPLTMSQVENFVNSRVLCEQVARRQTRQEDVTLEEIYQQFGKVLFLNAEDTARLLQFEIDTEKMFITGVPQMIEYLHQVVHQSSRVLLLTDMYLPRSVIEELLDKVDPFIRANAEIYISSEEMKTKRSGNLFRHVLAEEGIKPELMHHFGDNRYSDYVVPRKLGINATHVYPTKLKNYELVGRSSPHWASGNESLAWQISAGLSRSERILDRDPTFLAGHSIAGPLLIPYVTWLLRQAKEMDIKRLHFVARDGQILHAIAKRIQEIEGCGDIELRYLHGSRQAWHLPATREVGEHELAWVFQTRSVITIENIAKRIDVGTEELIQILKEVGVAGLELNVVLGADQLQEIRTAFCADTRLKELFLERARVAREVVKRYLGEQGLFDGTSFAIVDVGWTARSQDSLLSIIEPEFRPKPMQGFYFGLVHYTPRVGPENKKYAFALYPEYAQFHRDRLFHFIHFVETFASADHGSTMGYEEGPEGRMVPILDGQGEKVRDWGLKKFQDGILSFAEKWCQYGVEVTPIEMQARVNQLVDYFVSNLAEPEIADVIGSFPYASDQEGWNQTEFGPRLSFRECLSILRMDPAIRRSYCLWPEGSAVRSGGLVRFMLHPRNRWLSEIVFHQKEFAKRSIRFAAKRTPKVILRRIGYLIPAKITDRVRKRLSVSL